LEPPNWKGKKKNRMLKTNRSQREKPKSRKIEKHLKKQGSWENKNSASPQKSRNPRKVEKGD